MFIILSIIYFLLLLSLNIIYYFREDPHVRPKLYFIVLSIASGLIFIQIMFVNKKEIFKIILFLEILLIPISFTLTQQGLYHTVMGRDPWTHGVLIAQIIKNAHIPQYENIKIPYVWMPNFHLIISQYMLVGNVAYKWASYFSIGLLTLVLECIIAYKLGLFIFKNNTIAFLSVLFLAISDNVLDMIGKNIIPNSIGVAIAFLVFYLILTKGELEAKHKIIITLLIVGLSFLHTVSFAFTIIQTTFIFLTFLIYGNTKKAKSIGHVLVIMWVVAIFVWGLISGFYLKLFVLLLEQLMTGLNVEKYESSLAIPFRLILLARLGMIIYFGLAGIGVLYYIYNKLYKKKLTPVQLSVLINSSFFVGFGVLTFLIWPGIAHRFWYYGEILGSFFVAYLLLHLYNSGKYKKIRRTLTVGVVLILSWLMFVASISNDDNPLVKEYTIRTGWYDSEIMGAYFVIKYINQPVASDMDYAINIGHISRTLQKPVILSMRPPINFKEVIEGRDFIFIIRKKLIEERFFFLGKVWMNSPYLPLKDRTIDVLSALNTNKLVIYDNGNVVIYGGVRE